MAKITQESEKIIKETQCLTLDMVRTNKNEVHQEPDRILESLCELPEDKLTALGDVGKILGRFVKTANIRHPEMLNLTKTEPWVKLSRDVSSVLNGNSDDKERLNTEHKQFVRQLASVKPRFISDPMARLNIRNANKLMPSSMRSVGMKGVYVLGENCYYGKPSNFLSFVRFSNHNKAEIAALEEQSKVFASHTMPEVTHAVSKRIKSIQELHNEEYLGFQRIKPTDAAMVLARHHGLRWHDSHFVTVPLKFFDKPFWGDVTSSDKTDEQRQIDEMKKMVVFKDKKLASFDTVAFQYQPRFYPMTAMKTPMPERTREILDLVEKLPDAGGNPIFDYLWVLTPSINVNHQVFKTKDGFAVRDQNLNLVSFKEEWEAAYALDMALIKHNYFCPVVLGDRDGLTYFVCLWN